MSEIPKPNRSNVIERLSDDVYSYVNYELVLNQNLIKREELEKVIEEVYETGMYSFGELHKFLTLKSAKLNNSDEVTNEYRKGLVAGFLRSVFVMNEASIRGRI